MKRCTVTVALLLALSACGSDDDGPSLPASSSPTGSPSAGALPSPSATTVSSMLPSPAASTDLADGRHAAYVTTLDVEAASLTVDVVQFLTGAAAEKAAAEDGKEAFDYYIRNQNPLLRTLSLAPAPKVVVNTLSAEKTGSSSQDHTITLAELATYFEQGKAQKALFHLTLADGVVTQIREQYLP